MKPVNKSSSFERSIGIALVTGANSALGAASALALGQMGYDLALHYHEHDNRVLEVCEKLTAVERSVRTFKADLTKEDQLRKMFDSLNTEKLSVLVNNAAILNESPLLLSGKEAVMETVLLNQIAVYECIQRAARIMCRHNSGRIVNVGSLSQHLPLQGQVSYAMSKSALTGLTRSAALELGPFGITVNCVVPGPVSGEGMFSGSRTPETALSQMLPVRGLPAPEDIASCIAFFCSDGSRFITGQSLVVDAGLGLTSVFSVLND